MVSGLPVSGPPTGGLALPGPAPLPRRLRAAWQAVDGARRFLLLAGLLLLASAAFHAVVFVVSGGSWSGPLSWRKPILFGFSFGITAATLAWLAGYLRLGRPAAWLLLGTLAVASVLETALITLQTWRGVPSHFNTSSVFDAAVFSAMGLLVSLAAACILVLAALSFRRLATPSRAFAWTIRGGLVLLLASQALGAAIIAEGTAQLSSGAEPGVFGPHGVVFGAGGIMKSPHGLALHAAQVLPVLGWALARLPWTEVRRRWAAAAALSGYVLLVVAATLQAYTGLAPLDAGTGTVALATAGAVLVAVPYAAVVWMWLHARFRGAPTVARARA